MSTRYMIVQENQSVKGQIVTIFDDLEMSDVYHMAFELEGCVGVKDLETGEWIMSKFQFPKKTFLQEIAHEWNEIKNKITILKIMIFGNWYWKT
jgi:hypothetical protein